MSERGGDKRGEQKPHQRALEDTRVLAEYWSGGARARQAEGDVGAAVMCMESSANVWKNAAYAWAERALAQPSHARQTDYYCGPCNWNGSLAKPESGHPKCPKCEAYLTEAQPSSARQTTEGETPRTNAFFDEVGKMGPTTHNIRWKDFASQLERELASANDIIFKHHEIAGPLILASSSTRRTVPSVEEAEQWVTQFKARHGYHPAIAQAYCAGAESVAVSATVTTDPSKLRGEERAKYIHEHDCPKVWSFFNKYALGSKVCPSCLMCGHQALDRDDWFIRHGDLPDIYICKTCVSAARSATLPPSIDPFTEAWWVVQFKDGSIWEELYDEERHALRYISERMVQNDGTKAVKVRIVAATDGGGAK